jgi:hypothetical protein
VVLAGATLGLMSVHALSGTALGLIGLAMLGTRLAWQTTRTVAVFDRALARVVDAAGMIPLRQGRHGQAPDAPSVPHDAHEGYHAARGA